MRYIEIGRDLVAKIRNGHYEVGTDLPPAAELCTSYQCGKDDVERASQWLVSIGYLVRWADTYRVIASRE